MTPIKFPHQVFLENNKDSLKGHSLPPMLQKRILGFEELQDDLKHTTDEDHERLLSRLEKLSYELDEDLEDFFEEHLENNDADAESDEPPVKETSPVTPTETPELAETIDQPEQHESTENMSAEDTQKVSENVDTRTKPGVPSDEEILHQAIREGISLILPSELIKRGFKGSLVQRNITVGRFSLFRGKYDTCYRITHHHD